MSNSSDCPFVVKLGIYLGVLAFYLLFFIFMDKDTRREISNELSNCWK